MLRHHAIPKATPKRPDVPDSGTVLNQPFHGHSWNGVSSFFWLLQPTPTKPRRGAWRLRTQLRRLRAALLLTCSHTRPEFPTDGSSKALWVPEEGQGKAGAG